MADGEELEIPDWRKKESLRSVLLQIGVVALLLAGAVFLAWSRGVDRQAASAAIEAARGLIRQGTETELRGAVAAVKPALASTTRGPDAHAIAARAWAELAAVHEAGPDALEWARAHLGSSAGSELEERATAEALVQVAEGKAAEAIHRLEPLAQKGPRRLDVEYVLARAHVASGWPDRALRVLARAAEVAAGEPRVHTLRGDLLLVTGEHDAALASYRRALATNAQHPAARLGVALAQARKSLDGSAVEQVLATLRSEGAMTAGLEARAAALRPATAAVAAEPTP